MPTSTLAAPMRAVNPMRSRRRATDELRLTIACLPRATREAMLAGIASNPIIAGAYSTSDGICPMLAAHRAGGRTNLIAFADAWDRFAGGGRRLRRARRATERELRVLRAHLEASLLSEEPAGAGTLGAAIADHRRLVAGRAAGAAARRRRGAAGGARAGDRDRRAELAGVGGWAWTRLYRRYDDYAGALERLYAREVATRAAGRPTAQTAQDALAPV